MSIDVNPYTALVTWPLVVASDAGRAKNARYDRLCPSRRKIRFGARASVGIADSVATSSIVDSGSDGSGPTTGSERINHR